LHGARVVLTSGAAHGTSAFHRTERAWREFIELRGWNADRPEPVSLCCAAGVTACRLQRYCASQYQGNKPLNGDEYEHNDS
jgi:hypothetical protein